MSLSSPKPSQYVIKKYAFKEEKENFPHANTFEGVAIASLNY